MGNKNLIIILVAVALIAIGGVVYFLTRTSAPTVEELGGAAPADTGSLGSELFEQASNPLGDELGAANPIGDVNPIKDLYLNPFE